MSTRSGLAKRVDKRRLEMEMKKIFKKLVSVIIELMLIVAAVILGRMWTLGGFDNEEFSIVYRDLVPCDEKCQASTKEPIRPDGKIEIQRPIMQCNYNIMLIGVMTQMYWAGPWTTANGDPLPDGIWPDDLPYGEPFAELTHEEDGKLKCYPVYNMAYGQRGVDGWMHLDSWDY